MKWMHEGGGPQGLLTTAGGLLFGNDGSSQLLRLRRGDGEDPVAYVDADTDRRMALRPILLDGGQFIVSRRAGYGVCVHAESLIGLSSSRAEVVDREAIKS